MEKIIILVVGLIVLNAVVIGLLLTMKVKRTLTHEEKLAKIFKNGQLDNYY